jgi:hypothetical protein
MGALHLIGSDNAEAAEHITSSIAATIACLNLLMIISEHHIWDRTDEIQPDTLKIAFSGGSLQLQK